MSKHPMQPIVMVGNVIRFKQNAIVRYLLDNGGIDLNKIAVQGFSDEDQMQFAQLIGYSVSGYGDLNYASAESVAAADEIAAALCDQKAAIPAHAEITAGPWIDEEQHISPAVFSFAPEPAERECCLFAGHPICGRQFVQDPTSIHPDFCGNVIEESPDRDKRCGHDAACHSPATEQEPK